MWFLRQMRRWGWQTEGTMIGNAARSVYRPDLFSLAAGLEDLFVPLGSARNIPVPAASWGDAAFENTPAKSQ
jgi:hypothetical protein